MKRIISILLVLVFAFSLSSVVMAEAKFADVEAGSVVEKAVYALSEKNIISGYPDGTFKPDGKITRAEFATVIAKAKGLPITLELDVITGFNDLDADAQHEWARPYVKAAVGAGILNGFEDGSFRAGESVTYEQAIKMIVCSLEMQSEAENKLAELQKANAENTTWSSGYIAVANDKNLTKDAAAEDITAPATRGIVAILTNNALSINTQAAEEEKKEEAPAKEPKELKKLNILAFGNSYTDDSFYYLGAVGRSAGYDIYAVNMFTGSAALSHHWKNMNGEGVYASRKEYTSDSKVKTTKNVSFDDGLATNNTQWDFITLHQKGESSPFYSKYCPESKPYITDLAKYIRQKSPKSELLFFENWCAYTDRIEERYEEVYKPIVEGLKKDKYRDAVFAKIKESYLTAAKTIGNPKRVIPAGEAIFRATEKYGFEEYVKAPSSTENNIIFVKDARCMYRDSSSHLSTYHGRILSALTWFEYLTDIDVREISYQHVAVSAEDMALLKEIAHEVCSLPEYNK